MPSQIANALFIFLLRTMDVSIYTLRLNMVRRHRKALAWLFAFCQSLLYVNAVRVVLADMGNWMSILGYATGFATGLVLGMVIEGKLAIGHIQFRIISPGCGNEIAENLRQEGFGVTQIPGRGRHGSVDIIHCNIYRKDTDHLIRLVSEIDQEAFIAAEEVYAVKRGFWGKRIS